MVTIREEKLADAAAREALLDKAYGMARFAKTSERLREGCLPASRLSLVAVDHCQLVGTVRYGMSPQARAATRCCWARSRFTRIIAIAASARR
jgi:predicted N-acetyltransferase YhbS